MFSDFEGDDLNNNPSNPVSSERYYFIDLLRFLFSIAIIWFHLIPTLISLSSTKTLLFFNRFSVSFGHLVICFFIMGGFFLFQSVHRETHHSVFTYACERLARLWPMLAFVNIVDFLFSRQSFQDLLNNLFLLKSTGLTLEYTGYDWFVAPLFWASIFAYFVITLYPKQKAQFLLLLAVFIGYTININNNDGFFGRKTVLNLFSMGLMQALSSLCLGCLIAFLFCSIDPSLMERLKRSTSVKLFVTALEVLSGAVFFVYICSIRQAESSSVFVITFSVFFSCIVSKLSYLRRLFHKPVFQTLGKYSYSVYLMQIVVFDVLKTTLWTNPVFLNRSVLCSAVSILIFLIAGILGYYLIENPSLKLYKKIKKSLLSENVDCKQN